jgi:deoxyribodipyrimidine photo-lyase
MNRAGPVLAAHQAVGEAAALDRLRRFLGVIGAYQAGRDRMDLPATSGLSENLTWGEIGPRQVWHAGFRATEEGAAGAETFLKELVWREFAWALAYHTPHILKRNWREDWDRFPWQGDSPAAEAWRRGRTGEPVVDAAMRELWVTGRMHNRARMIVASYLTKHMLTDWRIGQAWFAETLTDWDAASNAMGWQWVAGCGPDAAPYFRIFNPGTQAEKFDPEARYRRYWLSPLSQGAQQFFAAAPRAWQIGAETEPPEPVVALEAGRRRALEAFAARNA